MPKLQIGKKLIECKLIVFDKDGTLIEQKPVLLALAQARYQSLTKLVSTQVADEWAKTVGINMHTQEIDYQGPLAFAPTREEVLITATIIRQCQSEEWRHAKELAREAYEKADGAMKPPYGAVLIEGVEQTLRKLKADGFKIALASTDSHRRAQRALDYVGIGRYFDVIIGDDDVENGKPAPDMILKACELTECLPSDAVMVGDSLGDVLMGRNAHVKACIGVFTGATSKERLETAADVVIPSVAELQIKK
jgi:phosphoglycolate phosphatase